MTSRSCGGVALAGPRRATSDPSSCRSTRHSTSSPPRASSGSGLNLQSVTKCANPSLDGGQLARVIVRIAGLGSGPWLLALDRTCWKFGRHEVNVLMLAIIRNGIAIPVMWDVLGRAGNSTTAQRSALLSRFCAVFGETAIAGLIADREFIGTAWMASLAERDIPFILRIKDTFHVRLSNGRQCQVRSLFRKVGVGGRRYIPENCRLGSRDSSLGPPLKLAAMRLVSGDLLVVAT